MKPKEFYNLPNLFQTTFARRRAFGLIFALAAISLSMTAATIRQRAQASDAINDKREQDLVLRIKQAELNPDPDIIDLTGLTGTINLSAPLPIITTAIEFRGPGADNLTIRRGTGGDYRIFTIALTAAVTISGITVSNGLAVSPALGEGARGGGILNEGKLHLSYCGVTGNAAKTDTLVNLEPPPPALGGGVYNSGTLEINHCTFADNKSFHAFTEGGFVDFSRGGGVFNASVLTINNSTFSRNTAAALGGAVRNEKIAVITNSTFDNNSAGYFGGGYSDSNTGSAQIKNSTFSANSAAGRAGGLHIFGSVVLLNATVTGNKTVEQNSSGGGIHLDRQNENTKGKLTVYNSIIAGNTSLSNFPNSEISGDATAITGSHNFVGAEQFQGCAVYGLDLALCGSSNLIGGDPKLGALQDNGGNTRTHALSSESPAIDAGNDLWASPTDQRGRRRFDEATGKSDLGAFERQRPIAVDDSVTTAEDTSIDIVLTNNDRGFEYDDTLTLTPSASGAQVTINQNPSPRFSVRYTPPANFNGADSFTYTLREDGGATSTATVNVNVTPVSDAPVLDVNGAASPGVNFETPFGNNDGEISVVDANLTVGDADGDSIKSATVALQNRPDGDAAESLALTASLSGTGLTAAYNSASGTLTISGAASPAVYETVLRSAVYRNGAAAKSDAPRTIVFSISDGALDSLPAVTTTFRNVLHIENSSTREGNSGTSNAVIFVSLDRAANSNVQINYATHDGTAQAGSDYLAATGTLTILAGSTSAQILIPIIGDTLIENQETFTVKLSNPARATLDAADTATIFIQNDDGSLVVNTVGDTQDATDGKNSLREAISFANSNPGAHAITFDLPADEKNAEGVWEIVLTSALPALGANPTTIAGTTSAPLVVRRSSAPGTPLFTVFRTFNNVTISNLTISGGDAPSSGSFGGGIFNGGTLTLTDCTLSGNRGAYGGGLYNQGTLQMTNCTISGNAAQGASNSAGGGFYNNFGDASFTNCTITDNIAVTGGGAARSEQTGIVRFRNTIVAGNRVFAGGGNADLAGVFISGGYNLIGDAGASVGFVAGANNDQVGGGAVIDARLASLAANGGTTKTHALLSDSPAIDAGNRFGSTADQRGFARPYENESLVNATGGDGSDIGAFEAQPAAPVSISDISNQTTNVNAPIANITFTVGGSGTLTLSAASSNSSIIPVSGIAFSQPSGAAGNRALNIAAPAASGTSTITVSVSDGATTASDTFVVTVNEINSAPVIAPIPNQASSWGNLITFAATATDADVPFNTLTFSLDSATAPTGATITPSGVFAWTPTAAQVGTYAIIVRVADNGTPSKSDSKVFNVAVGRRATVVAYTGATSGQYSDGVMLRAALKDAQTNAAITIAGKPIAFRLGSQTLSPSPQTDATGAASGNLTLAQAANSYLLQATFAGDATYEPSAYSAAAGFNVGKEYVETKYTGDTAIVTSSAMATTATVRLAAHLDQQPDAFPGDITLARVTFELFKSSNFSDTPDRTVTNIPVNASGDALATLDGLAAETYTVKVKTDAANLYWTANPIGEGVLNVTIGTNDVRTSGGGWIADAGGANGKGNFGFTVRPGNGGAPKGNAVYIFRAADPATPNDPKIYDWIVKSNSWQSGFLNFAVEPGTNILSRSSFKGRCNVQKIDPETGQTIASFGNYALTIDSKDGDLLKPRQSDAYAITILDGSGAIWRRIGTSASLVALGGGNITNKSK